MKNIYKKINEIDDLLDLAYTWVQIDKNTKINIEDSLKLKNKDTRFIFRAIFYDCEYSFTIDRKDISSSNPSYLVEGDSKLFDSFEDFLETEELFKVIKKMAFKYQKLENKDYD